MDTALLVTLAVIGALVIGVFVWFFNDVTKRQKAWDDNFEAMIGRTARY